MTERTDVERLLRSALPPVDPPSTLSERLERRLTELTDAAADELADWELRTMRDPRNWGRPIAAAAVGGFAGGALVVVRWEMQRRRRRTRGVRAAAGKGMAGMAGLRRRLAR